jgi:hypothetical protein
MSSSQAPDVGSSQAPDVGALFQQAHEDDAIGQQSLNALQIIDLGAKIADAMGVPADQFNQPGEVILLSIMVDNSGSIRFAGNSDAVRDGCNTIVKSLVESKQNNNIMALVRLLSPVNGVAGSEVLFPYGLIDDAPELDQSNYNPSEGTPLYDETLVFLGSVLAKAQEYADQGVPCRTISLIITDGEDVHSPKGHGGRGTTPDKVKVLVEDMLRAENHIIGAMGIKNDAGVDYNLILQSMGIRSEWISTPKSDPSSIRAQCQVFSQSAVRASQSAASFSQQALGGFGN